MNSAPSSKRLSKADRREQLLQTAFAVVREQGTDALTLGYLAERAGVSKPIAYEHFETRPGLLIALYKQIDAQQATALVQALERTPRRLDDMARVMSTAYMHCYTSMGPEWHAISAALKGDEQMVAAQQQLLDGYVDFYAEALAPFVKLPKKALRLRCVGIIGAAEAISRDMLRGQISEAEAAATMGSLMVSWLPAKG